jgi:FkbM family methyltransferase
MNYKGQAFQDKWVCEFFNFKTNGYFLDIGAMDGITSSNTYELEHTYKWNGLCVEPYYLHWPILKLCRSVPIIEKGIYNKDGFINFNAQFSNITSNAGFSIPTITFKTLVKENKVPNIIDYISLDVEGTEYEALSEFPFDTHVAILWTIEHNLYLHNDPTLKNKIKEIMFANDYVIGVENVFCADSNNGPFEDWFIHKNYYNK